MSQELVKERVLKYLIEDLFVPQDMIDTNVSLNEKHFLTFNYYI